MNVIGWLLVNFNVSMLWDGIKRVPNHLNNFYPRAPRLLRALREQQPGERIVFCKQ
jgi:hypothetical protein